MSISPNATTAQAAQLADTRDARRADSGRAGRPRVYAIAAVLTAALLALLVAPGSATAAAAHAGTRHEHHHAHHHHRHHHHRRGHHHERTDSDRVRRDGARGARREREPRANYAAGDVSAPTATEAAIARRVLSVLNHERAAHRLAPLRMNGDLQVSARQHDESMAAANDMSHQVPGEKPLGDRETDAGYNWTWAGENIGWNSDMTSDGVVYLEQIMYDERPPNDGHRLNILNVHYTDIGVDVLMDPANNKVWLTTDFGCH